MNAAIIGIGNWGKNLVREFNKQATVLTCVSNGRKENLSWLKKEFPNINHTSKLDEVLNNPAIDSVVIATPIGTHYEIAKRSLLADKHIFVEKPTVTNSVEFEELNNLANERNKVIFTGYIYLYSDIYKYIKKSIINEKITSLNFSWRKMGSFKEDLLWNLLSHDIALCIDLLGEPSDLRVIEKKGVKTELDIFKLKLFYGNLSVDIYINRYSESTGKRVEVQTSENQYIWEGDSLRSHEGQDILAESSSPLTNEVSQFINLVDDNKYYFDEISQVVIKWINIVNEK